MDGIINKVALNNFWNFVRKKKNKNRLLICKDFNLKRI